MADRMCVTSFMRSWPDWCGRHEKCRRSVAAPIQVCVSGEANSLDSNQPMPLDDPFTSFQRVALRRWTPTRAGTDSLAPIPSTGLLPGFSKNDRLMRRGWETYLWNSRWASHFDKSIELRMESAGVSQTNQAKSDRICWHVSRLTVCSSATARQKSSNRVLSPRLGKAHRRS